MVFRWFSALTQRKTVARPESVKIDAATPPTDQELQEAQDLLDAAVRPAVFGEIGGVRPRSESRASSWWGGNFLGAQGEDVPVCASSGARMSPILQIRVDELPERPPELDGIALLTFWLDLKSNDWWDAQQGEVFEIRAYSDLGDLVPLGAGYRDRTELPTFPVTWRNVAPDQPNWEDLCDDLPQSVAWSKDSDWFFQSAYMPEIDALREAYQIKIGGWPSWIQSSDWPLDSVFVFQLDSTDKGKLFLGDAGSLYVFKTNNGWRIKGDCF